MARRFEFHGTAVVHRPGSEYGHVIRISAAGMEPMTVLAEWAARLCECVEQCDPVVKGGKTTLALVEGEVNVWVS